jgi:hypothetical protein
MVVMCCKQHEILEGASTAGSKRAGAYACSSQVGLRVLHVDLNSSDQLWVTSSSMCAAVR